MTRNSARRHPACHASRGWESGLRETDVPAVKWRLEQPKRRRGCVLVGPVAQLMYVQHRHRLYRAHTFDGVDLRVEELPEFDVVRGTDLCADVCASQERGDVGDLRERGLPEAHPGTATAIRKPRGPPVFAAE